LQASNNTLGSRLSWSLLALRLTVFTVMAAWTLDKFVNPQHSAGIFEHFYGISGVSEMFTYGSGVLQTILIIAFVLGFAKRISYGLVFILHGASTLSSFPQYLDAFNNLLFFAAWPMWAACFALYLLRDADTRFTISK
jgi:uncharacterized membrane protein